MRVSARCCRSHGYLIKAISTPLHPFTCTIFILTIPKLGPDRSSLSVFQTVISLFRVFFLNTSPRWIFPPDFFLNAYISLVFIFSTQYFWLFFYICIFVAMFNIVTNVGKVNFFFWIEEVKKTLRNNSALDIDIYQSHQTLTFHSIFIILEAGHFYQKIRTSLGISVVLLNFTLNIRAYLTMCFIFYDFILQDKMTDLLTSYWVEMV